MLGASPQNLPMKYKLKQVKQVKKSEKTNAHHLSLDHRSVHICLGIDLTLDLSFLSLIALVALATSTSFSTGEKCRSQLSAAVNKK